MIQRSDPNFHFYLAAALAFLSWIALMPIPATASMRDVDAAIVLAIDISLSIDEDSAIRQKQGHVHALRSKQLLDAIARGPRGCIAVTYIEWASSGSDRTILPWTEICNRTQAANAADVIERQAFAGFSRRGHRRTSISYAIDVGSLLLEQFPARASRKVIDISSNGTNNDGVSVDVSRLRALGRGHIINGIVLASAEPGVTDDLPGYFQDNVIGGPGAFVMVPQNATDYCNALLRKLVMEIAGIAGKAPLLR